ncbi:MAG TPA: glycosyltransferase family 2 protein [Vicinamibacterales bacterium]|nr:glycosyltransferase family 2 protein [Vicinamibacterales bacterium]
MTCSIVIATYNRAADLKETLASLAAIETRHEWEVVVVDNNSPDGTRGVVEAAARNFPVPLRYVFERAQGRSPALNAGIAVSAGDVILTTDDDVRVERDWIDRAIEGLERLRCDYVGGRVLPIWGAARPDWLPDRGGKQWAVIALLDYGPASIEFGTRVPLGVNMAFRRTAFERAGLLDPNTGRKAGTLLGQEVREWCIRARQAGVHGWYVPEMLVHHVIPASRLKKSYFRRWFYWRGVSRALLYGRSGLDMEAPEQTTLDFRSVPHVFGVPRYLYRRALEHAFGAVRDALRRDRVATFEHELWLWFFAGIVGQRWKDRKTMRSNPMLRQAA